MAVKIGVEVPSFLRFVNEPLTQGSLDARIRRVHRAHPLTNETIWLALLKAAGDRGLSMEEAGKIGQTYKDIAQQTGGYLSISVVDLLKHSGLDFGNLGRDRFLSHVGFDLDYTLDSKKRYEQYAEEAEAKNEKVDPPSTYKPETIGTSAWARMEFRNVVESGEIYSTRNSYVLGLHSNHNTNVSFTREAYLHEIVPHMKWHQVLKTSLSTVFPPVPENSDPPRLVLRSVIQP